MDRNEPHPRPWATLMRRANELAGAGRTHDALACYDEAVHVVDGLLCASRPCAGLLMAKIVSHHNRASARARAERYPDADTDFACAHALARCIADDPAMPAHLRDAARRHRSLCFADWHTFRTTRLPATARFESATDAESAGEILH